MKNNFYVDKTAFIREWWESDDEKWLSDTVSAALKQIRDKNYAAALGNKGIPEDHIRSYGFAFCGKKVLIGMEGENPEADTAKDEMQIRTFIENGQDFDISKSEVCEKLISKFDLNRKIAEHKIKKFWRD